MKRTGKFFQSNPLIILVGINIVVLILGFTEFFASISGDTSIYAYYGRQINQGLILYKDLWDFKSPGIYYLFALLFKFFPDGLTTLRISAVLSNSFASIILYKISTRYFSTNISLMGTAIFLFVTNIGGFFNQDGPYPETYIPFFGVLGFYFWLRFLDNRDLKINLLLAGMFGGILIMMKQSSVSFVGACLFYLVWSLPLFNRKKLESSSIFVTGIFAAILPWAIYFYSSGSLGDFLDLVVLYPRLYAATTPLREAFRGLLTLSASSLQVHGVMWILSTLGAVFLLGSSKQTKNDETESFRLFLPWIFLGVVVIILPGRFYERYLMEILIPVIFVSEYAIKRLFSVQIPEVFILGLVLGCFFILGIVVQQSPRMLYILDDRILSNFRTRSETLAENSLFQDPGVTVFAWGDPRIPYVTKTQSAVKWLNTEPFLTSCTYVTQQVIDDFMTALNTHPAKYFIESPARPPISQSCLADTPIVDFINQHYELMEKVGDASIYIFKEGE